MSDDGHKENSDKDNSDNVDSIIKNIDSLVKDTEPDAKSVNDAIIALSNKREDPEEADKKLEDDDEDLSLSDFTDSEGSGDEKKKKSNGSPAANVPGNADEDEDEDEVEDEEEEAEKENKNTKKSFKDSLSIFLPKSLRGKSFKEDKTNTDDEEIGVTAIGIKSDSGDHETISPKPIAVTKITNPIITTAATVAVEVPTGPKTRATAAARRNKERNENVPTDSPLQSKKSWSSTLKKIPSVAKFGTIKGALDTIKDELLIEKDYANYQSSYFKTDKKKINNIETGKEFDRFHSIRGPREFKGMQELEVKKPKKDDKKDKKDKKKTKKEKPIVVTVVAPVPVVPAATTVATAVATVTTEVEVPVAVPVAQILPREQERISARARDRADVPRQEGGNVNVPLPDTRQIVIDNSPPPPYAVSDDIEVPVERHHHHHHHHRHNRNEDAEAKARRKRERQERERQLQATMTHEEFDTYREERRRRHERRSQRRARHTQQPPPKVYRPYFIVIVTLVDIAMLVYEFIKANISLQEMASNILTNPSFGPDAYTLYDLGAKYFGCGRYFNRLLSPIFMHAGILHITLNMIVQIKVGIPLEKQHGTIRVAVIYILSGLGGNLLSGIFLPSQIQVGASGALYGLLGILLSDLIQNWKIIERPWIALTGFLAVVLISLATGLLPISVDNFAHVGGFISGILLGMILIPTIHFGFRNKILICIAVPVTIAWYTVLTIVFYLGINPAGWCAGCYEITCLSAVFNCAFQDPTCYEITHPPPGY